MALGRWLPDLLLLAAVIMLILGLYRVYEPLAWIGGAIVLLLLARAEAVRQRQRPPHKDRL